MSKQRRFSNVLILALVVCGLVALGVALTSGGFVGRRLLCQIRYYADPRYWSNWVSFGLWLVATALAGGYFVTRSSNQEKIQARLEKSSVPLLARIPRARYGQVAFLLFAVVGALVVAAALIDFKGIGRFLRYKLYGEFVQGPITALVERGEFDPKLLLGPGLILGAIVVAYLVKKRRGKLVVLLVAACGAALTPIAAPAQGAEKRIRVVAPAEYNIALDPETISATPSVKNDDGGYDANDAIVKCFAEATIRYTGGAIRDEEILFRLREPLKVEPGKKYPLVIWFHGYGESVGDNRRHLAHLHHAIRSFIGKDALDFYMIALQIPNLQSNWMTETERDEDGKGDSPFEIATEIYRVALEELPIDPDRVEVIGISSGAHAAWRFAFEHSEEIASLVVFSAVPDAEIRDKPQRFTKMAIWAFNNEGDIGAQPAKVIEFAERINELGGNAYDTAKPHGHHDSWAEPLAKRDVIAWSVSQSRTGAGRLQDVPYPKRSWLELIVKFFLPMGVIAYFVVLLLRPRRDNKTE